MATTLGRERMRRALEDTSLVDVNATAALVRRAPLAVDSSPAAAVEDTIGSLPDELLLYDGMCENESCGDLLGSPSNRARLVEGGSVLETPVVPASSRGVVVALLGVAEAEAGAAPDRGCSTGTARGDAERDGARFRLRDGFGERAIDALAGWWPSELTAPSSWATDSANTST